MKPVTGGFSHLVFFPTHRQQKDVALVNMANILHRAHFSADAAILAHAALDLTSDLFTSHYTLGNIYAVSHTTLQISCVSLDHRNNPWLTILRFFFNMCLLFLLCNCLTRCLESTTIQCCVMSRHCRPSQVLSRHSGGNMLCCVSRSWSSV